MIKGQRVLVTGGSGVIGRELIAFLKRAGVSSLLSLDREPLGDPDVRSELVDLSSAPLTIVSEFSPEVIFHLAATFERTAESPDFFSANWGNNTALSHRLVEMACRLESLKVFIFASSYLVYSPILYLNKEQVMHLDESQAIQPRNLCGMSKLYTEHELNFADRLLLPQTRVVNARIFRVYGRGSKDVISRWVKAGLSGQPIEVYGRSNAFDFVFAGDVAKGLLKMGECERVNSVVNLGSGRPTTITLAVEALKGLIPTINVVEPTVEDTGEKSVADMSRFESMVGEEWNPTSFEDGLRMVVDYEKRRLAG